LSGKDGKPNFGNARVEIGDGGAELLGRNGVVQVLMPALHFLRHELEIRPPLIRGQIVDGTSGLICCGRLRGRWRGKD
jgi:hypothetical protein